MELIYYIRNTHIRGILDEVRDDKGNMWVKVSRGEPIGVVLSNAKGKVGWSLCGAGDRFNKETGKAIARQRIKDNDTNYPYSLKKHIQKMKERSERFSLFQ